MSKIAIIDMGTNTFHLLLAEVGVEGFEIIHREHEAVRIGMAGINEGFISDDACGRALHTMVRFKETINRYQAATVYAFGTSAFRHARNAGSLASEITKLTGIPIRILSGKEEAQYIFEGIKAALDLGKDMNLVMDIGAGSVEFIVGDRHTINWKESFEIGGQRLIEKFQKHDPILPEEVASINSYLERTLAPLGEALIKFQPHTLIGSSGTFDTLSDIFLRRQGMPASDYAAEKPLSADAFYQIHSELLSKSREERMEIPGMIALRVDLIVVGSCLVHFVLQKHSFQRIRISSYSLKEGVLAKLAG
jgi:exopolyphosphatase / guanosine-5'-triphosphate,3'-diphosphate pyrophosphatase